MKNFSNITFIISVAYILIVTVFLIWHRVGFSPDQFFAIALIITFLLGRAKQFIHDWSVPILLFLGYDYARGLVPLLSQPVNIFPMIDFDRNFFGGIPTNQLQSLLYMEGRIFWYDYLSAVLYMSHFVVPMILGFILWLKNKKYFKQYIASLLLLSYAGFITYILFPAMPPWMAAQEGFIDPTYKILDKVFASFATPIDLPSVYRSIGVNLVAAVPSLHAAYPVLTFLILSKIRKSWGLISLPYVFGVWFAIVYSGDHYVFDIVIGALYAIVSFGIVVNGRKILKAFKVNSLQPIVVQKVYVTKEFFTKRSKPF